MSISNLSCRMCLNLCSDADPQFWTVEYLLNPYDDYINLQFPVPKKICMQCCGNLLRLVAFRDRIRSSDHQTIESLDTNNFCRICMNDCEAIDIRASTIPVVLRLCSAMTLIPNQDFWGQICCECAEDLRSLGFFVRKFTEVQKILELPEFHSNFNHQGIDTEKLLVKCKKVISDYRNKMGDERLMQELSYLTYSSKRSYSIECEIKINPKDLFEIEINENFSLKSPNTKFNVKIEDEIELSEDFHSEIAHNQIITKEEISDVIFNDEIYEVLHENKNSIDVHEDENETNCNSQKSLNHSNAKFPFEMAELICDICGYYTHVKYKMKEHHKKHNKSLWVHCDLCPDRHFANKAYLLSHMKRLHLPQKSIICNECGLSFKDHAARHYHHLAKHVDSSQWKFSCSSCDKKCYSKFHLKDHEKTHSAIRSHVCLVCGNAFKKSSNMRRHVKAKHPNAITMKIYDK